MTVRSPVETFCRSPVEIDCRPSGTPRFYCPVRNKGVLVLPRTSRRVSEVVPSRVSRAKFVQSGRTPKPYFYSQRVTITRPSPSAFRYPGLSLGPRIYPPSDP